VKKERITLIKKIFRPRDHEPFSMEKNENNGKPKKERKFFLTTHTHKMAALQH